MSEHEEWFVVTIVRNEPGVTLQDLWERYRDHGGLEDARAAGDILRLIEQGYITATVNITEKGKEYLAEENR